MRGSVGCCCCCSRYVVWLVIIFMLDVVVVRSNQDHAPQVTVAPRDQRVSDNGVISFFCEASGTPPPEVYWKKDGRPVSTGRRRFSTFNMPRGSVLRIDPVRAASDDNSTIECVADNGVDEAAMAAAQLNVYPDGQTPIGYPRIAESPKLKAVEKGHNTVMLCSATGNPEPSILWLKNHIPVDLSDGRIVLLHTGQCVHCDWLQLRIQAEHCNRRTLFFLAQPVTSCLWRRKS